MVVVVVVVVMAVIRDGVVWVTFVVGNSVLSMWRSGAEHEK